jgi:hemerythrin-like metal-binding protein
MEMDEKYTWKDAYNTGVKFIDEQHQYFFNVVHTLKENLNEGVCRDSASKIFFSLAHYAEHFLIQEEIYLKDYHLPSIQEHKELHKEFIKRVIQFQGDYEKDIHHTCQNMLEYLEEWFDSHILRYDKEAIKYLKEKGL